jgi:release factor glutamine methyltransferase
MRERSWRLLEILDQTSRFLASRRFENPRLQAELLLAAVLGIRRLDLYLQFERLLTTAEVDQYRQYVKQRLRRVPLQYITGEAGFRQLVLSVGPQVLIPRPETEVLVGVVLEFLKPLEAPRVLDLGCGSGAIALSLAHEHQTARLVATDLAAAAVEATRQNARRYGLNGRLEVLEGDLFAPLSKRPDLGPFDAVVSNPPYVCSGDLESLAPEVRDYEPRAALDGGADGLDYYRRIAAQAGEFLRPGALLALEVGQGQDRAVAGLLEGAFVQIQVYPDLNRIPRVVTARCPSG